MTEKNENMLSKIKDATTASADSAANIALDHLPDAAQFLANTSLDGFASILADGIVSAIAPGVYGAAISYRQRRTERNLKQVISQLESSQKIINERISQLEQETQRKFSGIYRDAYLDTIADENQSEKVERCTNAYINAMAMKTPSDDMVFTLFHDLARLTKTDIRVLALYATTYYENADDDFETLMDEEQIDYQQYCYIRQKLNRFGLLEDRNEEYREDNLAKLQETVEELVKQQTAKKPRAVRMPKLKKISSRSTYHITHLGNEYLALIERPQ